MAKRVTKVTLDDLVTAMRDLMVRRFPRADWASIVINTPGEPNTVLIVTPRTQTDRPQSAEVEQ